MPDPPSKPYKFLYSYRVEDQSIFFGRDREIRMLIDDVLVNRIVVLFAHTGTGKTSLINAGVRPRLEAQGYHTFFVRVSKDPVASARAVLLAHPQIEKLEGERFAEQLRSVVKTLGGSIVLFFDQFEEFFLYLYKDKMKDAMEFIADIASLYRDEKSRVRTVFSMRENFFVEMDAFRDEIPTIFHKDSNLRLRRFDKDQAREAIVKPAKVFKTSIEAQLVERLLVDLAASEDEFTRSRYGEIEPAQLQIVCDSLWPKRINNRLLLEHYLELDSDPGEKNISRQVLFNYLESQFRNMSQEELQLLNKLLPQLRTREGTKYVRDFESLSVALKTPEPALRNLVHKLVDVNFVRLDKRDNLEVIELTHDYLVERLNDLGSRVRAIWPRREMDDVLSRFQQSKRLATPEELESIAKEVDAVVRTKEQAEVLFRSGLNSENRAELWFDVACHKQVEVWTILREMITKENVAEAFHALNLLDSVILRRQERDRTSIKNALKSFYLLRLALRREDLAHEAQHTLARLAQSQKPAVALLSIRRLLALLERNIKSGRINSSAIIALGGVDVLRPVTGTQNLIDHTLNLLQEALTRDDLVVESEGVLLQFTKSMDSELSSRAIDILLNFARSSLQQERDDLAFDVLRRVKTLATVRILQNALTVDRTADNATEVLRLFAEEEEKTDVNAAALAVLSLRQSRFAEREPKPEPRPKIKKEFPAAVETGRGSGSVPMDSFAHMVKRGECILFLGPGIHVPPPDSSIFEYPVTSRPQSGRELARYLADLAGYPKEDSHDLQRVSWYFESKFYSRHALIDQIKSAVQTGKSPSPLLKALAELPLSLVITTTYDNLFEQALAAAGKRFTRAIYNPRTGIRTQEDVMRLVDNPLVLKLYGDLDEPGSIVITDEDFLQFTLRMTDKHPFNPVPRGVLPYLTRWPSLFLGYSFRDFHSRLLFKALRWKMDLAVLPPAYSVDAYPDELIVHLWENRSRDLRFIVSNLWEFVPDLYQAVLGRNMPKS